MSSLSVSRSLLTVPGVILLAVGMVLYVGSIVVDVIRVGRQYSSAMAGAGGLRANAAFAAAGKRWYYLAVGILGAILLVLAR